MLPALSVFLRDLAQQATVTASRVASDLGRRAGFLAAAGLAGLVGLGFLTAALWVFLAEHQGAIFASGIIGLGFALVALLLVLAGRSSNDSAAARRSEAEARLRKADSEIRRANAEALSAVGQTPGAAVQPAGSTAPLVQMLAAFMVGINLAARLRGK